MIAINLSVTTNSSGVGSVTVDPPGDGFLLAGVEWIDGTFDDGVDAVLSLTTRSFTMPDRTLLTLTDANNDATYYPRTLEHSDVGAALATYTLPVVNGTLKLSVTSGGNTKTGGCVVYLIEA